MNGKMSRDDVIQLIPAYTLGALDTDDRVAVEALLLEDQEAQAIADDYRQIVDVLPLTVTARQVDPALKTQLFNRIHEEKPRDVSSARRIRRLVFFVPIAAMLVLAMVGFGVVLQAYIAGQAPDAVYYELLSRANVNRITVMGAEDSPVRGELIIDRENNQAAMRLIQMPSLPQDQVFQLWMVNPDGVQDGGLYQADETSELYIVVPNTEPINQYVRFGVSIEPAGGSPLGNAPTGPRVFSVQLPADA